MGEVYRARDTKLKRDVAVNVLPETFASDPERLARFQREAELLASLNHPNIAHIYGVEERALVMELVEGESPQGPMAFEDAWKVASQIAAALEYAHERGIIHRDLKPANVKVTPAGVVKLLDFGLAKAFNGPAAAQAKARATDSSTLTLGATHMGVILGTAAYMSPEQAKGKPVDRRADIWSFGVMLYELLTGERLFEADDASDTLAQVLTKRPDFEKAPERTRRLLDACLEKDPRQRLRDVGDAARLITQEALPHTSRKWKFAAAALGGVSLVGAGIALVHFREPAPQAQVLRYTIPAPGEARIFNMSLSPDGRYLAVGGIADRGLELCPLHRFCRRRETE
jgi:serine/threonine-protein kinase